LDDYYRCSKGLYTFLFLYLYLYFISRSDVSFCGNCLIKSTTFKMLLAKVLLPIVALLARYASASLQIVRIFSIHSEFIYSRINYRQLTWIRFLGGLGLLLAPTSTYRLMEAVRDLAIPKPKASFSFSAPNTAPK
jgi:hypothetical protein